MTNLLTTISFTDRDADSIVARHAGKAITWRQWHADVAALRARLQQQPQGCWPVYFTDSYRFSVAVFALWSTGNCPLLLPDTAAGTLQGIQHPVAGHLAEMPLALANPLDLSLDNSVPSSEQAADVWQLNCKSALSTSGSSGKPTTVEKSHSQLILEIVLYANMWAEELRDATVVATVSHQHIYGLLFKILLAMYVQRPFVSAMYSNPRTLLQETAGTPTAWVASPAQLKRMNPAMIGDLPTDHVKVIFSSGGLLPAEAAAEVATAFNNPACEIYGSTETGGIAWRQQADASGDFPWRMLRGVAGQLDPNGLLMVRSGFTENIWVTTGDRVKFLPDGEFSMIGRADRLVKLEEKRVSLTAIELACVTLPAVSEARAVVLPGKREQLAAVLILSKSGLQQLVQLGRNAVTRQLKADLGKTLPRYSIPRRFRFVAEFPQTTQGKTRVQDLVAEFETGERAVLPVVAAVNLPDAQPAADVIAITLQLAVPVDLDYFAGHFASFPVLPGVSLLAWVRHFARLHLGFSGDITRMSAVKFKAMVRPGQQLSLELAFNTVSGKLSYRFYDKADFASGHLWDARIAPPA